MRAGLSAAEGERDRLKGLYDGLVSAGTDATGQNTELSKALESRTANLVARPGDDRNPEPADRGAAPSAVGAGGSAAGVGKNNKDSQTKLADLGQRLNVALAQRIQELSRYRSEFFGRLRAILGNRPDIRIVGDRFVFQSEVFFDTGQAVLLPEGRNELDQVAAALVDLDRQIPADIPWVLRVDGHTDLRPITSPQFPSNWELSSARAIAVVQYLISKGVSPQRLVAAGFGEFSRSIRPRPTKPTNATVASS